MARWRVCLFASLVLTLLPAPVMAQQPLVSISAPSFANRHSNFAISVTSTCTDAVNRTATRTIIVVVEKK
jgi:hypothetical protein